MPSESGLENNIIVPNNLYLQRSSLPVLIKEASVGFKTGLENFFLRFCSYIETDRGGSMPEPYSEIAVSEFPKLVQSLKNQKRRDSVIINAESPNASNFDLEIGRLAETVNLVENFKKQTELVRSQDQVLNPIPNLQNESTIILNFTSDLHIPPSDMSNLIRANAFNKYVLQRFAESLSNIEAQTKQFPELQPEAGFSGRVIGKFLNLLKKSKIDTPKHLDLKGVFQKDAQDLFLEWVNDVVNSTYDGGAVVHVSMGDLVTDGAKLLDEIDIANRMRDIFLKPTRFKSFLLELNGNHDQDARIPESFEMLTELFGHRVFAQEMGGVLVAAVDTNIENPEWIEQFIKRTGDSGKALLEIRKKMQVSVLNHIINYEGKIVLIGHNPDRMLDSFAIKRDIIQKSNVVYVIGGHTHREAHGIIPFKNKKGDKPVLHVIESVIHINPKTKMPEPSKLFQIKIKEGNLSEMITLQEPQDRFGRRWNEKRNINYL